MNRITLSAESLFGFISALLAVAVVPKCVRAKGFTGVESLAPADCTVLTVATNAHMRNVERQGELAGETCLGLAEAHHC
jgi:hypothetical protein